jgi:HEAT repeats
VRLAIRASVRFFCLLSVISCGRANSSVVPSAGSEPLPKLFTSAAIVLKGEVSAVSKVRETLYDASIIVDRVYKGRVRSKVVHMLYTRPAGNACTVRPCIDFEPGEYDLFFLSYDAGRLTLIDQFWGKFRASRLNGAASAQGLAQLEQDLVAGLSDANSKTVVQEIELLGAIGSSTAVGPLTTFVGSSDTTTELAACVALIRSSYYQPFEQCTASSERTALPASALIQRDRLLFYISELKDPKAVPVLLRAASSSSDDLRQAAIHALRETHMPSAVPTLVGALNDRVQLVRYDAVFGLAATEQRWDLAPSVDEFESQESKYINAWKFWWNEAGKSKYGAMNLP